MRRTHRSRSRRAREVGTTLVEVLVGAVVGLVVILVALDVSVTTETRRRQLAGQADAQQTAALQVSVLGAAIANAGHGYAAVTGTLASCPDTGDIRTTLRPVAVLITPGAGDSADTITVVAGSADAAAGPLALAGPAAPGDALGLSAPLGIAPGDRLVVANGAGACAAVTATSVTPPAPDGRVDVLRSDATAAWDTSATAVDLGPEARFVRVRFDVVDGSLRSLDLTSPGAVPNPLASNVVMLKAQYGVDDDGDGRLDRWADPSTSPWTPREVLAAPAATLARIRALRLGLIVRSDAPDPGLASSFAWTLFDCGGAAGSPCPGRLTGSLPAARRYRTQEIVVPLRNAPRPLPPSP